MRNAPQVGEFEPKAPPQGWGMLIKEVETDNFQILGEPNFLIGKDKWFLICLDGRVVLRGKLGFLEWNNQIKDLSDALEKMGKERVRDDQG